jgi:hypothetical protein
MHLEQPTKRRATEAETHEREGHDRSWKMSALSINGPTSDNGAISDTGGVPFEWDVAAWAKVVA